MKNQKGFTLIEMLIVLAIISTLMILLVPNLAAKNTIVQDKGCEALRIMVDSQMLAYEIDKSVKPETIADLMTAGDEYITDNTCANGAKEVTIGEDGKASIDEISEPAS